MPRALTLAPRAWLPIAVSLVYLWPFPHFEILRSPNELSRLYQVRAIVDDGALHVNGPVARYGSMGDLSERDGRLYPNKAPGISLLGAPVYAVVRAFAGGADEVSNRTLLWFLRVTLCILPTLLLLPFLRRYAARLSGDAASGEAAILVYALGTLAMPYSLLYFSHQLSAVLAIAAFLLLESARRGGEGPKQVLAGLCAGWAVVTEYTLAPVAAMLALYALVTATERLPALARVAAGALPCVVVIAAYHTHAWGHPLATGYAFVQNKTFASWHAQGYMGVAAPKVSSLLGNLFTPARGLFAFSPALLLALPGLWLVRRDERTDGTLAIALTAFYFFIAAAFLYEAWGWMFGPRHLTPLAPFLVAPLACAIAWLKREQPLNGVGAGFAAGLVLASIAVTSVGSAIYPHIPEQFTAAIAHLVGPLLRDGFLPWNAAELFLGRAMTWTWIPWFLLAAALALAAAWRCLVPGKRLAGLAGAAGALALMFVWLVVAPPAPSKSEVEGVQWIERHWEPKR